MEIGENPYFHTCVAISIELSDGLEKYILLLLDNKGLFRECANLQTQLSVVATSLDKLR